MFNQGFLIAGNDGAGQMTLNHGQLEIRGCTMHGFTNGGVGIFCLDKTFSANNSVTLQPTFMYQSNSSLGIGTSNPQTTLDVAGDITSSNLFVGHP